MHNSRQLIIALTVLSSFGIASQAQNPFDAQKQFSATMVTASMATAPRAGQGEMKIYRSGDKLRTTMPGGMGYMITDLTQGTSYMVMNTGMCMQTTASRQPNPFAETQNATIERVPAGADTVDGHSCKVENLTVIPKNGTPVEMKIWEANDLKGFPVRVEMNTGKGPVTVEYQDVSFDPPQASLFSHPANCRQMPTMPGAMPQ
jgi:hypothetical protein